MMRRNLSHSVSTSSTATGGSILSKSTVLTHVTSIDSITSNVSMNKGFAALVNLPSTIFEAVSSRRPSLAMAESIPIQSDICQHLTVIESNNSSHYSSPEITTITPVSAVTPATGLRGAVPRFSAAREVRKSQKAATKAARKEDNRARSRAYFADFYANDSVGAWHNAPAMGFCSCGCNDDPLGGSDIEDPVPVAELVKMHSQSSVMSVTRMVNGRAVTINF